MPAVQRPIEQGAIRTRDNGRGGRAPLHAEPFAGVAPSELAVETEVVGAELIETRAAASADELGGEEHLACGGLGDTMDRSLTLAARIDGQRGAGRYVLSRRGAGYQRASCPPPFQGGVAGGWQPGIIAATGTLPDHHLRLGNRLALACGHRRLGRSFALPVVLAFNRLHLLHQQRHNPVAQRERMLDALGEPGAGGGAHHRAVDHDLYPVLLPRVQRRRLRRRPHLAVHPHTEITGPAQPIEKRGVGLAVLQSDRRQQNDGGARWQREDAGDDLIRGLRADRHLALRAVPRTEPRPQHPHVVVDFGHRADRRTRALARRPLLDANRG